MAAAYNRDGGAGKKGKITNFCLGQILNKLLVLPKFVLECLINLAVLASEKFFFSNPGHSCLLENI